MRSLSQKRRRVGVVVNHAAAAVFLVAFYAGLSRGWGVAPVSLAVVGLAAAVWSFVDVHVGTGLWTFVHAPHERLDEREAQVARDSLRHAYAIFTVVALAIMLLVAVLDVRGFGRLGVLVPAVMIYFAHTLPSSVLAWTEKRVGGEEAT